MTFGEIILLAIVFQLGWFFGQLFQLMQLRKNVVNSLLELEKELTNISDQSCCNIMQLNAEEIDNVILIYDKLTNEFICQADSIEEAAAKFNQCRTNIIGALIYKDSSLLFIDGKISK